MKRIISTFISITMIFTLSITAFAEEIDRTAIKNKLFEYIWTEEMADEEEFHPAEQNPVVAFAYGQVCEFIDSLTDREINRYNISDPETTREYTIRQVRKDQFDEWCEEKYDHWFVDYDEDNNVWIMETKEYGDLTFRDDQAEWRLFDKDNNVVKSYRKPTNLPFLTTKDDSEINTTIPSQKEVSNSKNANVSASEGPAATESDNNSNESESSSESNSEANKGNTNTYIILTVIVVILGVIIVIYYTKRKEKKK